MVLIEVKNLKKTFGKKHALEDVTFKVEQGEVFGFLGPNGAGKTTTIRCMMNFIKPSAGEISIFGTNINNKTNYKEKIGYLSGDVRLYDTWTGRDHILFLESLRGKKSNARDLIKKLNFDPHLKFKALSSGNKQKLGLILALMYEPDLLVLDEPTVGLDPLLQNTIYLLLEDMKRKGKTIFISSHNLPEVDRICDRVGIIRDGRIVAIESIRTLKEKRMHYVRVTFNGPFEKEVFQRDGLSIEQELPEGLIIGVKGNLNDLVKLLSGYNIKELEISHASLEDIFLEFYGPQVPRKQEEKPKELINNDDLKSIPELE